VGRPGELYLMLNFLKSRVFLIINYYTMKQTNYKNLIKHKAKLVKTAIPEPPEWKEEREKLQAIRRTMQSTEELYRMGLMELGDKVLEACHREIAAMPGMEGFNSPFIPEGGIPMNPDEPTRRGPRTPRPIPEPEQISQVDENALRGKSPSKRNRRNR
jgi:hypothetical protein